MKLSVKIADWIRGEVKKADKKGLVFGLSGGVDSTVVAYLAKLAMGKNVLTLILPCESKPEDVALASELAGTLGIEAKTVSLDGVFHELAGSKPAARAIAKANLKPRLRMAIMYYFANALDYLVAGTGNKSEISVGYFTKYGDGGVDILPLGDLLKTEVRKLARELGVPEKIIDRVPSAGLWEGQTDEGEMGITYEELDRAITAIEKKRTRGVNKEILSKVKKMMAGSRHKRAKIPVFKN